MFQSAIPQGQAGIAQELHCRYFTAKLFASHSLHRLMLFKCFFAVQCSLVQMALDIMFSGLFFFSDPCTTFVCLLPRCVIWVLLSFILVAYSSIWWAHIYVYVVPVEPIFSGTNILILKWISDSYCSLKPLWSTMRDVVPARTSPPLHPPSPPTLLWLPSLKVSQYINCCD